MKEEEGGLWNRWEVLAMSINQSQPRMRLHPVLLHSRFHRKPAASLVLGLFGARVLAARLAGYTRSALHPCTPHLRREFPKRRGSFPFSSLTKTTTHYTNEILLGASVSDHPQNFSTKESNFSEVKEDVFGREGWLT
jgi:hypothetical protein